MQKRTTSAVPNRERVVNSSETERNERMDTSSLMEQILSKENLNTAYLQVVRNKGAEGVDGMKYTELQEHLEKNGENIKDQLRSKKIINLSRYGEWRSQSRRVASETWEYQQ